MKYLYIIVTLIASGILIGCVERMGDREGKIPHQYLLRSEKESTKFESLYDSLKQILPSINNQTIVINDGKLPIITKKMIEIDSLFYKEYLKNVSEVNFRMDFETLFLIGWIDYNEYKEFLIYSIKHNWVNAHVYLVTLDRLGNVFKLFEIAAYMASPYDWFRKWTFFRNRRQLEITEVYSTANENERYTDSIVSIYRRDGLDFILVNRDSMRIPY